MKRISEFDSDHGNSRRSFLKTLGAATVRVFLAPSIKSTGVLAYGHERKISYLVRVAITNMKDTAAQSYDPSTVKQKVQYLFEQPGGIGDLVKSGDKVAMKNNVTGGSCWADPTQNPKLKGVPVTEAIWTHPDVIQAVGAVPQNNNTMSGDNGWRGRIHHKLSTGSSAGYLPESICDLSAARPVNLAVVDGAGLITSVKSEAGAKPPSEFRLNRNFPNPFNPSTTNISHLPKTERVSPKVYDVTGREVETLVEGTVPAGEHRLDWNATGLASLVCLCRLAASSPDNSGRFAKTIKMVYTK